jgi:hypothetical protein
MTPAPGRLFFVAPYSYAGDEPAVQVLSLTLTDPQMLYLPQGGAGKRYMLALNLRPAAAVTVEISSTDMLEISPNRITFTPDNWKTPQQINVRAPGGGPNTETRPATIEHAFVTADPVLSGAVTTMPVVIRHWRFGYLPTVIR